MKRLGLLIIMFLWAQESINQPVPYTLADRDRLIRLEERVARVEKELTLFREQYRQEMAELRAQLARMESRSDAQFYTLLSLIGLMLASIAGLIGFILWDRRKALEPIEKEVNELRKDSIKLSRLVQSLREYARTHPDLAEILRQYELV
ncbi:MAG: hypothetical protein N2253_05040 [Bacteroidia bacterium]|nr:hypothetical protein [Bacteroidia bacterium]MCX7764241.1 hypothetical protein [Bacteroidia bacterium]MDW8057428.1 hypothetical protein [Bacteroidia bacterium]